MTKMKHNIILFIEPNEYTSDTTSNIGNLYMNRFAIDEDTASEILKIYQLQESLSNPNIDQEEQKGMDRIKIKLIVICTRFRLLLY